MNIKKIMFRNLDNELQRLILGKADKGKIEYDDLDATLQELIRKSSGAGGTGGYDDTILFDKVTKLESNKANRSELVGLFDKKVDKVDESLLDKNILDKLNAQINIDINNYREKDIPINEEDLNKSFVNKINSIEANVNEMIKNSQNDHDQQLHDLNLNMTMAQERITEIEEEIDTIHQTSDLSPLQKSIESNKNRIDNLENNINDLKQHQGENVTEENLDSSLKDKIGKITEIEENVKTANERCGKFYGNAGDLIYLLDGKGTTETSPMIFSCHIAEDEVELAELQDDKCNKILDLENDILYELSEEDDEYISTESFVGNTFYHNRLILDLTSNNLKCILNEELMNIASLANNAEKSKIIKANESLIILKNKALRKSITVLVKDTEMNSRTYGMFINSEAVVTVAYSNKGYTLFNDSDQDIEIIMI